MTAVTPPRTISWIRCPNAPKKKTKVLRSIMPPDFGVAKTKLFDMAPSLYTLQTVSDIFARSYGLRYPKIVFRLENIDIMSNLMLNFLIENGLELEQICLIQRHFLLLREIFNLYKVSVTSKMTLLSNLIFVSSELSESFSQTSI